MAGDHGAPQSDYAGDPAGRNGALPDWKDDAGGDDGARKRKRTATLSPPAQPQEEASAGRSRLLPPSSSPQEAATAPQSVAPPAAGRWGSGVPQPWQKKVLGAALSDPAGTPSAAQAACAPPSSVAVQQQSHRHHAISVPLEPCMFGQVPGDPTIKLVSDFVYKHMTHENVEIEAKLGIMIDKGTGERVYLPVVTETVLDFNDYSWLRFESNMSEDLHRFFNELVNRIVEDRSSSKERFRIHHRHTKEIDEMHGKVRVTRDAGTGEIIPDRCVAKTRIADLNVFSPTTRFDYRISVNVEDPQELPAGKPNFSREKDRITYTHQILQLDLTKVRSQRSGPPSHGPNRPPPPPSETTHEIELEFIDVKRHLLPERMKVEAGKPNNFYHMIAALVNNCRWLAKR